jgi:predicted nucleic acid-binding protein
MENNLPNIPSDNLASLRKLESFFGSAIVNARQLRLVIDTNVILKDLRWLISKRKNPTARTDLQEVIGSRTVIAFAPESLRKEVQAHITEIAIELGVSEVRLQHEWQKYEQVLHFYDPEPVASEASERVRDLKDLPFVCLSTLVGAAAVYTRDKDVPAMGALAITPEVISLLRDYSRAASIEITIKVEGAVILVAGIETIRLLFVLLSGLIAQSAKLSKETRVALLLIGAIALLQPSSRKQIDCFLQSLSVSMVDCATVIAPALITVAECLMTSQLKAKKSWSQAEAKLPSQKRRTVRVLAFAVCLEAEKPLSEIEIERGIVRAGYQSKSRHLRAYLRSVLRHDARLIEAPSGYWQTRKAE